VVLQEYFLKISTFLWHFKFPVCYWFLVLFHCSEKILGMTSILSLLRIILRPNMCSDLEKDQCTIHFWEEYVLCCCWYIELLSSVSLLIFVDHVSIKDLHILEREVLRSLVIILLPISPFISGNAYFTFLSTLMLSSYVK
jgi:hypothetical protein